ncbi:MAG: 3'-5' exonuclease [Clostridiales Family XIII bacterium]|jgi:DNA polymerase III alpha subunit (gram-positive type)|nr:3'-5' exonuclease [Clostridiales Family XIII bacterium]
MIGDFVVIDTETTGFAPTTCDVIEFGFLIVEDWSVKAKGSIFIDHGVRIPYRITQITGITEKEIIRSGKDPLTAIDYIKNSIIKNKLIVGHNISFDMGFLNAMFGKYGGESLTNRTECTLKIARRKIPKSRIMDHKLTTIADYFGIETPNAHRALGDCLTTFEVYKRLLEI